MQLVGARAKHNARHTAPEPSVRRIIGVRLNGHFLDRVQSRCERRAAGSAHRRHTVDQRLVLTAPPAIDHHAVDIPESIQLKGTPIPAVLNDTGLRKQQLIDVATRGRQIIHILLLQGHTARCRFRRQQRRLTRHSHTLGNSAHFHPNVHTQPVGALRHQVAALRTLEAILLHRQRVSARRQKANQINTYVVGHGVIAHLALRAGGLNLSSRDRRTGRVRNRTRYIRPKLLPEC